MKKFKNLLVICFAFFALAMLAGCVTVCQHETGSWAANKEEHWKTCSLCGEQVEKAAHNFGEFEVITAPASNAKAKNAKQITNKFLNFFILFFSPFFIYFLY